MIEKTILILLTLMLFVGCSNQPTNYNMISMEEYDEGLNLKVNPILTLQEGQVIEFSTPTSGEYVLNILNATGYTVRTYSDFVEAGTTRIIWDLTNNDNKAVKLGIYIYELTLSGLTSRVVTVVREDIQ